MKKILCWLQSQDGATAIEYALIAAGISVGLIAAIFLLGDSLENLFNSMSNTMSDAVGNVG